MNFDEQKTRFLAQAQNSDGGWGYFPGKESWLEPTAYALLALHPAGSHGRSFERGWQLMRSWQLPEGGWKPAEQINEPHWTTALCVTLHAIRGVHDSSFHRGVAWLLKTKGAEHGPLQRIASFFSSSVIDIDPALTGWPWIPDTSSWVEPTSHALLAMKMSWGRYKAAELRQRGELAERMLFNRRCVDGGWNYGNRKVYRVDLPSYPETTAVALLGLKGSRSPQLKSSLALASKMWRESPSPLAKAWLTIALHAHGVSVDPGRPDPTIDVLLTALQELASNRVLG
ncbi:MAG: hypothetical protein M3Z23_17645 [Acidobacteriota bacterium]|nr:hypothetical protein [Acidobacteriota bacterium]